MPDIVIRLGVLAAVIALIWLLVWAVRRFVERQRQSVLALPASAIKAEGVSILSFSTPDCRQCQTLQAPALERLLNAYGALVRIIKVDAVQEPELAKQYRVMTVPSTVVLDAQGQVQAVNYGFAPMQRLAQQIETLISSEKSEQ
jgi:Thioredoxin